MKDSLKLLKSKGKHIEEEANPEQDVIIPLIKAERASSTNEFLADVPHKEGKVVPSITQSIKKPIVSIMKKAK